jgi:peptidoglycan hydrolase CwlO-like protein
MTLIAIVAVFTQMLFASAVGAASLAELQQSVKQMRDSEAKLAQQREANITKELREQEKLARDALKRRDAAEARSNALNAEFDSNVVRIAELTQLSGNTRATSESCLALRVRLPAMRPTFCRGRC